MIKSSDKVSTPVHGNWDDTPFFIFANLSDMMSIYVDDIAREFVEFFSLRLIFILFDKVFHLSIFTRYPYLIEREFVEFILVVLREIFYTFLSLHLFFFFDKYTRDDSNKRRKYHKNQIYAIIFSRISLTPDERSVEERRSSIIPFIDFFVSASTSS